MENDKGKVMKCAKCGYGWNTLVDDMNRYIQCPKCRSFTTNKDFKFFNDKHK